jgi:hypothetical protein
MEKVGDFAIPVFWREATPDENDRVELINEDGQKIVIINHDRSRCAKTIERLNDLIEISSSSSWFV